MITKEERDYYLSIINRLERMEENLTINLDLIEKGQTVEQLILEEWNLEKYLKQDLETGIMN